VKVSYREAARDDVIRQFRYYLVTQNAPETAIRFRGAVRLSVEFLRHHPLAGPNCGMRNQQLQNLRSWPLIGFPAVRIYYVLNNDTICVVRILHGKQNVKAILGRGSSSNE
jgi:plasmid stabilization system protein ParE